MPRKRLSEYRAKSIVLTRLNQSIASFEIKNYTGLTKLDSALRYNAVCQKYEKPTVQPSKPR